MGKTKGQGISRVYADEASTGTGGKGSPEERLINAVGGIGRIRFVPRKPEEKQETRPVFRMREEFRIPNWDDRIRDEISAENGRPVFRRKYF